MKIIGSHYKDSAKWIAEETDDYFIFDRSDCGLDPKKVRKVPNIGSDLLDKFTFIVENYDDLPDVATYIKTNLFKFISRGEYEKVKHNKFFTPLLTMGHRAYLPICFYGTDGLYYEKNDYWYLNSHPPQSPERFEELVDLLGIRNLQYNAFAPGSSYILPKENILKHPKSFYEKLITIINYDVYPGECHIIERALYTLWK